MPVTNPPDHLFLSIFEKSANSLFVKADAGFTIVAVSDSYLELICSRRENLVGKTLDEAFLQVKNGANFASLLQESFTQVIETRQEAQLQSAAYECFIANQSEKHTWSVTNQPVLDDNGEVAFIIHTPQDITRQINAAYLLEESKKQLHNLVLQSPVAMCIIRGQDMVIELYNQALLKLWGKEDQDVTGRKLLEVFPELRQQQFPGLLKQVYETGVAYSADEMPAIVETDTGITSYFINFLYRPLFDADGKVSGIMITANDVTEQVEARYQLEIAEERLRLATEATGFGTFDLDMVHGQIAYSQRLAEIFGYGSDQVFKHSDLRDLIHPEDIGIVDRAFETASKNGIYFYEARNVWPDSSVHWIRTQGNVIFDENKKPVRIVGTVVDVTSQRHIINELQRSEENMRLAYEAAELGTFDWVVGEKATRWDARHREIFGMPPEEDPTYEESFLDMLHPDDRDRVTEAIDNALNKALSGGNYDVDYRIIRQNDKKLRWIRAKGKALFNEQEIAVRLIGTIVDVTDRKQDEIRKNDFIAMASHELKTPLTSLKAYIQMLLSTARKANNQFFSTSLEKADNQIDKMTKLIYGFLDLSKIEAGKLQLDLQRFNIHEALNEAIADVQPIAQSHKIIFEPDGDFVVNADREKISQVVINLVNNAIKYSPKGSTVTVAVKEVNEWAEVTIKDEGIGINSYDLHKIFQRFYRVQDDKTKGFSGFGIGLYLSAEIIALHHGKIGVESNPGQGSIFYFRLPKL